MLLDILLVLLILVCVALGGVVLLQRSEGGALGMGGGPSGFLTTRGAGDLLTRVTWILGAAFFVLCLSLTIIQGRLHKGASVVDRLKIDPLAATPPPTPIAPPPTAAPTNTVTGFEAPAPQVNAARAGATTTFAAPPPVASKPVRHTVAPPQATPSAGKPPAAPAPLAMPTTPAASAPAPAGSAPASGNGTGA